MKKIIFGFCSLMAFMNAEAQVLEVWDAQGTSDAIPTKVLSCHGLTFSAEVYTKNDGTNSVAIKQGDTNVKLFENNSTAANTANRHFYHARVFKQTSGKCVWGTIPTEGVDLGQRVTLKDENNNDVEYKVLWAPWNLGASSNQENGCYFSWGEISDGNAYDKVGKQINNSYVFDSNHFVNPATTTKTVNGQSVTVLASTSDIAYEWWNGGQGGQIVDGVLVNAWRIPTKEEWQYLVDQRYRRTGGFSGGYVGTIDWANNANVWMFNNVNYTLTLRGDKTKSITLYAGGFYKGNDWREESNTAITEGGTARACNYLSSTLASNGNVYVMHAYANVALQDQISMYENDKVYGYSIRPVMLVPVNQ